MEIIQITEEQAECMYRCWCGIIGTMESRIEVLRKKGYIKQSALEKARAEYHSSVNSSDSERLVHSALVYYKDELEKALGEK